MRNNQIRDMNVMMHQNNVESNKTKEEIEQLGREIHYQSQNEGLDSNGCFNQYQGFIKGYTQCQEKLTARILELESQINSLTNLVVMEVSCKCDDCEYFNNILTPKNP